MRRAKIAAMKKKRVKHSMKKRAELRRAKKLGPAGVKRMRARVYLQPKKAVDDLSFVEAK